MIDDTIAQDPSADSRRSWTRMREKMRETIHAELDRINPTDDARRALELIIESSVRPSEVDGELKLTVIDHDGKPRTIERDGQHSEFTLQDLLAELRGRYPVLFRPAKPEEPAKAVDNETPKAPAKPRRDWLTLDTKDAGSKQEAHPVRAEPMPLQMPQQKKLRIHEWSRTTLDGWKAAAASRLGPKVRSEDGDAAAAEHDRMVFGTMGARSWARPSLILGAVAVLALLGVGALLFRGDDAPSQAVATTSSSPSAATPGPIRDPEPLTTGSTNASGSLRGVPEVIDTATLSLNGEVVRLFGVEWAPGAGKPEDLAQYLQGREVACTPAGANDVYRCQVGGQDLSRVVLFNGGGKPTGEATPELKAAADKAREAKIGVWGRQQP